MSVALRKGSSLEIDAAIQKLRKLCAELPHEDEASAPAEQRRRWQARRVAHAQQVAVEQAAHRLKEIEAALPEVSVEVSKWSSVRQDLRSQLSVAKASIANPRASGWDGVRLKRDIEALKDGIALIELGGWSHTMPDCLAQAMKRAGLEFQSARPLAFHLGKMAALEEERERLTDEIRKVIGT